MNKADLVQTFMELRPASTFLSIKKYKNSYGEVSNFGIVLHASYENVLFKTLSMVSMFKPESKVEEKAKLEIVKSLTSSLSSLKKDKKEKDSDVYTHFKNADGNLIKGIKYHKKNDELYVYGLEVSKEVVTPVDYKKVKSKALTKAKNRILAKTPLARWRQFKLNAEKFEQINVEGISIIPETELVLVKVDE